MFTCLVITTLGMTSHTLGAQVSLSWPRGEHMIMMIVIMIMTIMTMIVRIMTMKVIIMSVTIFDFDNNFDLLVMSMTKIKVTMILASYET